MSSSSTSSVGIPSERSVFRNSFIPLINRLHSKSVSFSLVFLLNIKMTSLYLVIPFYKEVCVLSNVWGIILLNYILKFFPFVFSQVYLFQPYQQLFDEQLAYFYHSVLLILLLLIHRFYLKMIL